MRVICESDRHHLLLQ